MSFNADPEWREEGTESSADGELNKRYQQSGRCPVVKLSTVIGGGPAHPQPKPLPPTIKPLPHQSKPLPPPVQAPPTLSLRPSHPRSKLLPPSVQAPPTLGPSPSLFPTHFLFGCFSSHTNTLHLHQQTRLNGGSKARWKPGDPPRLCPAPQPRHGLVSSRGFLLPSDVVLLLLLRAGVASLGVDDGRVGVRRVVRSFSFMREISS